MRNLNMNIDGGSIRKQPPTAISFARWTFLVGVFTVMFGLHLDLVGAIPGLESAEASYAFEVVPGVNAVTKPTIEAARESGGPSFRRSATIRYSITLVALFVAYSVAIRALSGGSTRRLEGFIFGGGAVLLIAQMATPVLLSTDVLSYAQHGRALGVYGFDPTADPHPLRADDPFLALMDGRYPVWPYGALWTVVSAGVAKVCGEHVGLTILVFRMIGAASVLAGAAAIWGRLRDRLPKQAATGLAFFLWNPLVTIEAAGGAHIDAMMVGLLMLAFAWQGTGRSGRTMAALVLSALVKYATVVLVPLFLVAELLPLPTWRERSRALGRCAIGLVLPAVVMVGLQRSMVTHPAGATGLDSLLSMTVGQEYTNSWHELVIPKIRHALGEPPEVGDMLDASAGWWVAKEADAAPMLVVGVAEGDRLLVRQRDHKFGYIPREAARTTERPAWVDDDPEFAVWEWSPSSTKAARDASRILRLSTLGLFGLTWLWGLARVAKGGDLASSASAVLLAVCYFLGGWFWPWYALWPIASAALIPRSRLALMSALLCFGVLTLYATIGCGTELDRFRSLVAFGLPVVLFLVAMPIVGKGKSG